MDEGEDIQEKGIISKDARQEDNKYKDEGAGRQGRNKANGQANKLDCDELKDRKITKAPEKPGARRHSDHGGPNQYRHHGLAVIDDNTRHTKEAEVRDTRDKDNIQDVPRCSAGTANPVGTTATTARCTRSSAHRTASTTC